MTDKLKLAFISGMRGLFVAIVLVSALALSGVAVASSGGADAPPPPSGPGCPSLSVVCKNPPKEINGSLRHDAPLSARLAERRKYGERAFLGRNAVSQHPTVEISDHQRDTFLDRIGNSSYNASLSLVTPERSRNFLPELRDSRGIYRNSGLFHQRPTSDIFGRNRYRTPSWKQQLGRDRKISLERKQQLPYTEMPRTRFTNIRDAQHSTDRQFDKFWRSPFGKILLLFFAALVIKFLIDILGDLVALGKKRQKD